MGLCVLLLLFRSGHGFVAPIRLPLLEERVKKLREVGAVLSDRFSGRAFNMIWEAKGSAVELVKLVVSNFPGWRY
jgi:hypothetical protein